MARWLTVLRLGFVAVACLLTWGCEDPSIPHVQRGGSYKGCTVEAVYLDDPGAGVIRVYLARCQGAAATTTWRTDNGKSTTTHVVTAEQVPAAGPSRAESGPVAPNAGGVR